VHGVEKGHGQQDAPCKVARLSRRSLSRALSSRNTVLLSRSSAFAIIYFCGRELGCRRRCVVVVKAEMELAPLFDCYYCMKWMPWGLCAPTACLLLAFGNFASCEDGCVSCTKTALANIGLSMRCVPF